MARTEMIDLERAIKALPGVLGCVILTAPDGGPSEIQAFTSAGSDREQIGASIRGLVTERDLQASLRQIFVFELEAESHFGDRETLERAAELAEQEARARGPAAPPAPQPSARPPAPAGPASRRPALRKVVLTSTSLGNSEAHVSLGPDGAEVVGQARGEKTPHGLRVLAQATLDAAHALVGNDISFDLVGASLVTTFKREAVLVVVQHESLETIGAALVRTGPVSEAAVRATLDAINRRLAEV